jgi:hypothetical protein
LLTHDTRSANFLDTAVAVGDDPVAALQLDREISRVLDANRIKEEPVVSFRVGVLRGKTCVNADANAPCRGRRGAHRELRYAVSAIMERL